MGGAEHMSFMSYYNHDRPKTQGVECVAFPDTYRGPFKGADAGYKYAQDVEATIDYQTPGNCALFICESVQGAGGIVPMPEGYLPEAVKHVRAAGGLYCSDEV